MSTILRPRDLTGQLGISASTLRLWTEKFAPTLSPSATKATTEGGTPAQRRFTERDLVVLKRAKELLGQNKTYEETLALLREGADGSQEDVPGVAGSPQSGESALALRVEDQMALLALRQALSAKDETVTSLRLALTGKDETILALHRALAGKDREIELLRAGFGVLPTPGSPPPRDEADVPEHILRSRAKIGGYQPTHPDGTAFDRLLKRLLVRVGRGHLLSDRAAPAGE